MDQNLRNLEGDVAALRCVDELLVKTFLLDAFGC